MRLARPFNFFLRPHALKYVRPVALSARHVFFIVGHLVAVARDARAHVCKHSCAGAGEPRRRAESWRSAAASSPRWIGSRRSPKLRSSAVERAIGLIFAADAVSSRRTSLPPTQSAGRAASRDTRVCMLNHLLWP